MSSQTVVSIQGPSFALNGQPTYPGRTYRGWNVQGLLMNARLVQGIFDDANEATRSLWDYPDGPWDPDRNTAEFVAAMPAWREHGLVAFTLNLQGGSPQGYSKDQPWINSAFEADGAPKAPYLERLGRILTRADELGMCVILGLFYFGQDERLADEQAVLAATDAAVDWLCDGGWRNVIIEIANEVNVPRYEHPILRTDRCHELIRRVAQRSQGRLETPAGRLLVGASRGGGGIPSESIVGASDFLLLHGNGVSDPARIGQMVQTCRAMESYRGQPIVFNEDDHFDFDKPANNMLAAVAAGAGWGYFDYRMAGEGFADGYQSVPVSWGIDSPRKKGFFGLLKEVTGG